MKKYVVVGIILLFIASSLTPIVIGYTSYDVSSGSEELLEKLAHANYDGYIPLDSKEYNDPLLNERFADETTTSSKSPQTRLSDGPMDSPWSMFGHDVRHTGQSPYSTENTPGTEKWRFENDGLIEDSPVISDDGTIYFGGSYGALPYYLVALYPNGSLKWRYRTDGTIWGSSPAIAEDGTIYVGSWDAGLYAIYPDGTQKWRFPAGASIASSPAIADDGTIYFGNLQGGSGFRIYAVNPNGTEKWHYTTGGSVSSDPAIGDDGTIYIGSGDNYLYALYPNGTLRWRFKTGDEIHGHPSIADDGTIYIGSNDEYLYAIYPNNGTEKWRFGTTWGLYGNPSIANDGTIYVGTDKLYAIYPNGALRWSFIFGNDGWIASSSPAISSEGTIYIGTNIGNMAGGDIVAVNPDGTERWRKRIANDWVDSSPSIGEDGTVYIGSSWHYEGWPGGILYAFNYFELEAYAHGPYIGIKNEPVQFTGSASGGYPPYSFHWDFGDEESSEEQNPTHEYDIAGNYTVMLTVTEDNDSVVVDTTWALIRESNEPPDIPTIDGETQGQYGEPYDYTFLSIDPDEDDIWYYIEWGDGDIEEWIGPYESGEEVSISHTWDEQGEFTLRAKAKDIFDAESDWGTLQVTMPVNQHSYSFPLLQRLLERFPNTFPLLRHLLDM